MPRSSRIVLTISALFFSVSLISWFTLDPLKYVAVDLIRRGASYQDAASAALQSLRLVDLLLISATFVLAVSLMVLEIRSRAVSQSLQHLGRFELSLLLGSVLVWLCNAYLVPGDLVGGDASSHVGRIAHASTGLSSGEILSWDNYYYAGSPFLQYTGPMYFWLGALLDLLVRDPNLSSKILLFGGSVLSGAFLYLCLKEHGIDRYGAAIGAFVYAGSFAHLHELLIDGNHPQVLTMMLAPLSLMFLHRFLKRGGAGVWSALTLINIGFLVNHQSMAKHFGLLFIAYTVAYLVLHRDKWHRLPGLASSAVASILGAAFAIVPILLDHDWVMMYGRPRILDAEFPSFDYLTALFLWNISPSEGAKYLGMAATVLVLFAIVLWARAHRTNGELWLLSAISICFLVSLGLRGHHVKHVVATLLFFSFLVAMAAQTVRRRSGRGAPVTLVTLILLLDLSSTSVMPINRTDKKYLHSAGTYLEQALPTQRVLSTQTWSKPDHVVASIGPGASITSYYLVQHATGAHNLAATRVHNYLATIIKSVERELNDDGLLSDDTRRLLCFFNVGLIVNDTGSAMGFPDIVASNRSGEAIGTAIQLDGCSPFVFATSLQSLPGTSWFDKPLLWNENFDPPVPAIAALQSFLLTTLEEMQYDSARGLAQHLIVRDLGYGEVPPSNNTEARHTEPRLFDYHVEFEKVRLVVDVPVNGFLQLSHAWYPTLRTSRNGKSVSNFASAHYLTVVPVEAGRNELLLIYEDSRLRRVWFLISLASVLSVVLVGAVAVVRRRWNAGEST